MFKEIPTRWLLFTLNAIDVQEMGKLLGSYSRLDIFGCVKDVERRDRRGDNNF